MKFGTWGTKRFLRQFWPILTPLVLKVENFGQNWSSRAEKLATSLFLYGESEKNGPETICRPPRFQLGRFLLTLSLKNLFFLSFEIKVHFFKTFLLPHFDYCASLFIHFNHTQIDKINKTYNLCLYVLLGLELNHLSLEDQQEKLKPLNILPYRYRLLFRFSLFAYKIVNNFILNDIKNILKPIVKAANTRATSSNLYEVPLVLSYCGCKRISLSLTTLMNKVLKNFTNLILKDFKEIILGNLSLLYLKFSKFVLIEYRIVKKNFHFLTLVVPLSHIT